MRDDKTLEAWQVLKLVEEVQKLQGKVTIAGLACLAGGNREPKIRVKQGRGAPAEVEVDIYKVARGKVRLTVAVSRTPVSSLTLIDQFPNVERRRKFSSYSY